MAKQRHRRVKIEDVVMVTRGLDLKDVTRSHGRLILGTDGLFFIHGWDERRDDDMGRSSLAQQLGLVGVAIDALVTAILAAMKKQADRWKEDAQKDGLHMLAEVQSLAPRRQVARIAGSFHVPLDDIERASSGWLTGLRVTTTARGDEHRFHVPRAARRTTKQWVAAVARSSATRAER